MRGWSNTEADPAGNLQNISLNFCLYLCGSRGGNINTQKVQSLQLQKRRKTYRLFRIEGLDFGAEEMCDKSEIAGLLVEDGH